MSFHSCFSDKKFREPTQKLSVIIWRIVCYSLVHTLGVVVGLHVQAAMVAMEDKQDARLDEFAMTTVQLVVMWAQLITAVEEVVYLYIYKYSFKVEDDF